MNVHSSARRTAATLLVLSAAAGLLGACAKSQDAATTDTSGAAAATTDTAMAGMKHDSAGAAGSGGMAMNESAPKDSNQAFLRMMVDHHEGLITMASAAQGKLQSESAKSDAQKLIDKQKGEQQQMKGMLSSTYSDQHMTMVPPSNKAMNDSLQAAQPGTQFDKDFYHHVVAHHREGVQMIDKMLPHLTGQTKQMAEKSKSDQQREIQEFERKAGGSGPKG